MVQWPDVLMRNLSLCSALLLVSGALAAEPPRVAVDPRVELMSILFRLAGNPEYNQCRVPGYNQAIDRYFAPFKDHEAVRAAKALRAASGVSFDAVMSMAIHLKDVDTLAERIPFDSPDLRLDKRWHGAAARPFLAAARRFVADTQFRKFLDSQAPLYESTGKALRTLVETRMDLPWFEKFFGSRAGARFIAIPGLANGGGSYGPSLRAEDGVEETYAVLGVWQTDSAGLPTFAPALASTLVHEFAHSYANPLIAQFEKQIDGGGAKIYEPVRQAMQSQAYGNGGTVLRESLVRASTARYVLAHDGPEAARAAVQNERSRSFLWTGELFDLLGEYEKDREKYPTLESFMPRVVALFNGLSGRVSDMVRSYDASRPKVVSMTPPNGATDVDPALTSIVVRFDRPMRKTSYAVNQTNGALMPKIVKVRGFDETGTVFTMDVQLEPDRDYEFSLNWQGGGSFASADSGALLEFVRVRLHTRPAAKQ